MMAVERKDVEVEVIGAPQRLETLIPTIILCLLFVGPGRTG
jgi:hypothetical protein